MDQQEYAVEQKNLKQRIFSKGKEWGWAGPILRIPTGIIFMAHGSQKLFGLFGGYGLEGTGQFMASLGLEPGYVMALLAGSAEFFGGLLLIIGLLTRVAGLFTAFTMLVAVFAAHISSGLFASQGGFEFAMTLAVVSLVLVLQGGGKLSVDEHFSGD